MHFKLTLKSGTTDFPARIKVWDAGQKVTRATPVLFCFNYDAMASLKSLNLSIAVL